MLVHASVTLDLSEHVALAVLACVGIDGGSTGKLIATDQGDNQNREQYNDAGKTVRRDFFDDSHYSTLSFIGNMFLGLPGIAVIIIWVCL